MARSKRKHIRQRNIRSVKLKRKKDKKKLEANANASTVSS